MKIRKKLNSAKVAGKIARKKSESITTKNKDTSWYKYEDLVFKIYSDLEPYAEVKRNDYIYDYISETDRQIDVSIRARIAGYEILIIIQVKDYKRPVDLTKYGEFVQVVKGVSAAKGVMISHAGFSKPVKIAAKKQKIELCSAFDAMSKKWNEEITIPVLCKKYFFTCQFKFSINFPSGFDSTQSINLTENIWNNQISYTDGSFSNLSKKFSDVFSIEEKKSPLVSFKVELLGEGIIDMNGMPVQVSNIILDCTPSASFFFKNVTPVEYQGIKNHLTGEFKFTKFAIKNDTLFDDQKGWSKINSPDEIVTDVQHIAFSVFDLGFATYVCM